MNEVAQETRSKHSVVEPKGGREVRNELRSVDMGWRKAIKPALMSKLAFAVRLPCHTNEVKLSKPSATCATPKNTREDG